MLQIIILYTIAIGQKSDLFKDLKLKELPWEKL